MLKNPKQKKKVKTYKDLTNEQKFYNKLWHNTHTRCINVRFNLDKDKDLLDFLDRKKNKTDYIRQLIINDMQKGDH